MYLVSGVFDGCNKPSSSTAIAECILLLAAIMMITNEHKMFFSIPHIAGKAQHMGVDTAMKAYWAGCARYMLCTHHC